MITSSVSDCICGSSAKGSPTGHESIARSVASRITSRVGTHPLAVKGRQQQLALAQMLGAVEQQHRALAHDRAEHRVGLAGAQFVGRAAEHLLDQSGLEDHHEARVEQVAEGHDVAVASTARVDEASRHEDETERLQDARQRRARRHRDRGGGRHNEPLSQAAHIMLGRR